MKCLVIADKNPGVDLPQMTAAENVEVASDFDNRKADHNQYLP